MAPGNENKDLPLPPVPDVVSKMPWIQLGDFEVASSRTPPPKPYPARSRPAEKAAARFNVHGNAVCMNKSTWVYLVIYCFQFLLTTLIVTGGTGMLAIVSARALLEHGLSGLALFDLPSAIEKGKDAVEALRADFPSANIITQSCDVTDEKGMVAAVQTTKQQLGDINVLCCFAGMVGCVPSAEQSADHWRKIIDVNTTGCWIAAQAVARLVLYHFLRVFFY